MNSIAIIGAGPAGLATAIRLKKEGFDSIVLEDHASIGVPENCAGLISKSGIDRLKINCSQAIQNTVRGAKIYSPNGTELKVTLPTPVAYVVDRKKFDQLLLEEARNLNIHVATNTKLIDVRNNTLFVQANGRGEIRKAEFVVGADGVNSTVRHLMELKTTKDNFIHTIQATCTGEFEKEYVQLYLGDFAKGFFAWVVPISDTKAKIGLGTILGENVAQNFEDFLKEKLPNVKAYTPQSSLIPYGLPLQGIVKKNMALVGDAAFQTKATTGGGIIFGMESGNVLAQTIASELKKTGSIKDYEKNLKSINRELKMHWKIRSYVNNLNNDQIDKLFVKLKNKGIEEFLEINGDMDNPSKFIGKLAKSPKYWFMAKTLLGIARS
ncbi:MAG: NAD(P)/FAD-dependent oxidoreductase [archaeon]|jgi:geranylgeranyl reductase family protein